MARLFFCCDHYDVFHYRPSLGSEPLAYLTVCLVFGLPVFIAFLHIAIAFWDWDVLNLDNYKSLTGAKILHYLHGIAPNAYTWQLALGWIAFHIFLYFFVSPFLCCARVLLTFVGSGSHRQGTS